MLNFEQSAMLCIFLLTLLGLIKYQRIPQKVFGFSVVACIGLSLITTDEFFNNAINPGLITLVLLVICSFALERTSFLRFLASKLFSKSAKASFIKVLLSSAFASAFLNNTAVVATLITPIKNNKLINPGKLLLPLSYAAILGGTLTLVGTSTNLIVNSMVIDQGLPSLSFFDFSLVGLCALVACFIVLVLTADALPNNEKQQSVQSLYFIEAKVNADSTLIGKTIDENGLRSLDSFFLVEIIRQGHLISPVAADEMLHANDKLIFTGDISKVLVLQQFDGIKLYAEQDDLPTNNLTEVLIKPGAAIIGQTLKQSGFRARFDAAVVAIRREGAVLSGKLGEINIQSGDFLVLAVGNDFSTRSNLSKNFFILSGVSPENILSGWRDKYVILGFIACIASSAIFNFSLLTSLLFFLSSLFLFKCVSVNEVKRRFPLEIWLIVTCALSLSTGLENTGLASIISEGVNGVLDGKSVFIAFVAVYLITLLLTELITNNAAAALIFPIAYNIAIGLGVSPMPFIMAVAFAASGSFISPYGYQTNLMVFNAGNYRLKDFIKVGLPISITYSLVVLYAIPIFFEF